MTTCSAARGPRTHRDTVALALTHAARLARLVTRRGARRPTVTPCRAGFWVGGVPVPIGTLSRLVGTVRHGARPVRPAAGPVTLEAQREALDRFAVAEIGPLLELGVLVRLGVNAPSSPPERLAEWTSCERAGDWPSTELRHARFSSFRTPRTARTRRWRAEIAAPRGQLAAGRRTQVAVALVGDDDGRAPGGTRRRDWAARPCTDTTLLVERLTRCASKFSDVSSAEAPCCDSIDAPPIEEANAALHIAELTLLVRDLGALLAGLNPADTSTTPPATPGPRLSAWTASKAPSRQRASSRAPQRLKGLPRPPKRSRPRRAAASTPSTAVQEELRHLEMPDADIRVDATRSPGV